MRAAPLALLLLIVALVAGCAAKDGGSAGSGGVSAGASGVPSPGGSPGEGQGASSSVKTIRVAVSGGEVSPRLTRVEVARGQRVRIEVTTDRPDQVHVHGYDVEKATAPGKPAVIELTADIPGLFEVETHESDLLLFQLEVR